MARSGTLPLSLHIERPMTAAAGQLEEPWDSPNLVGILSQVHRIRDLYLAHIVPKVLAFLTESDAAKLESLMVTIPRRYEEDNNRVVGGGHEGDGVDEGNEVRRPNFTHDLPLFNGWQTPRLHSLMADGYTGWRSSTFGTLHHFILTNQNFDLGGFRTFLDCLSANPTLEDLVILDVGLTYGATKENEARSEAQRLPKIDMPRLKRIYISCRADTHIQVDCTANVNAAEILSSNLLMHEGCAQWYRFSRSTQLPPLKGLTNETALHAGKLYLDDGKIVGVNEHSGFSVDGGTKSLCTFLQQFKPIDNIEELYIDICKPLEIVLSQEQMYQARPDSEWNALVETALDECFAGIKTMRNVKKLVLGSYVGSWLKVFLLKSPADFLPALAELHLHVEQMEEDGNFIVQLLKLRAAEHKPIRELHFIRTSRSLAGASEPVGAYDAWKEGICEWNFSEHIDRIDFVNHDTPAYLLSMEIPAVCRTESPVHGFWRSWYSI